MENREDLGNLDSLRQYEREHLHELEGTAMTQDELLVELYKPKSERIKKYADTLAERVDQKDPMLDIQDKTQISSYIRRKYREVGIAESVIAHIGRELPEEYKNLNLQREQEIITEENGHQMVSESKPPEKLENTELLDRDEYLSERQKKLKSELALLRDQHEAIYNESFNRKLQLPSQKTKQISTQKPEAAESLAWTALGKHIETLQGVRDKLYEFPPTPEEDADIADAIDSYNMVFKPFTDLKWAKSFPAWINIQLYNERQSKHGAAVTEGAVIFDDGTKRILTRERVGDSAEEILENASRVLKAIPIIGLLATWHRKSVEPPVGQRRKNLGPRLSELA